ncbi:hypothetical protein JB92DRAFT_2831512 [Gautieria morchelliformis]|nr:hypothetical protein JB92DRAFT_2831512 [Gautieria morchelliformis]
MMVATFHAFLLSLVLLLPVVYKAGSQVLVKRLRARLTALDDLPLLSDTRKTKIPGTAVICGGSVAGLITARVCSNHFEKVVMIEPEEWVTAVGSGVKDEGGQKSENPPPKRSRIAQYGAFHAYHAIMTVILRRLFPQVEHELGREGARRYPRGSLPRVILASRAAFETTLRRMVLTTCPNVSYHAGSVIGLVRSESPTNRLAGVKLRTVVGEEQHISALLVVDCTGPAHGGYRWLKDLPPVACRPCDITPRKSLPLEDLKIAYDPKMAYMTCIFDVPSTLIEPLKGHGFPMDYETAAYVYIYLPNSKVERNHMMMQRQEKNTWCVADLRSFMSHLVPARPIPGWVHAMLDLFEQEDVPATYCFSRCPPTIYIQYHRAKNLPSNFIAVGDSVLQVNPVAGQGCTKAFVEAVTLNRMLTQCVPNPSQYATSFDDVLPSDFGQRFFAAQAKRTGRLWESMKITDYSFETTTPAPGDNLETTNAWRRVYAAGVMRLCTKDPYVAGVTYSMTNWLAPSTDAFSPVIVAKVLWLKIRDILGM